MFNVNIYCSKNISYLLTYLLNIDIAIVDIVY